MYLNYHFVNCLSYLISIKTYISNISTYQSMIISRFYNYLTLARTSTVLTSHFSTYDKFHYTPLQSEIASAKTIAGLLQIFRNHKSEITPAIYGFAIRPFSKLLLQSEEALPYKEFHQFWKDFEKLDILTFSKKEILNIFTLLRGVKRKKFEFYLLKDFKNKLVDRYVAQINASPAIQDLQDIINSYFELSCLKSYHGCKSISNKLLIYLEKEKKNGRFGLNQNQLNFMMYSLSTREDLNKNQCKIRSILLDEVVKDISTIKIESLVRIASSLIKMDIFDFSQHDYISLRSITKRIIERVTEFDENSIFQLISGEYINKYNGFFKIYEEILTNILAEINENGESALSPDIVIRAFQHLSKKFNLTKLKQKDQQKFIKFLDNYIKISNQDELKSKIYGKLQTLINNDFFLKNQRIIILDILKKYNAQPTIKLIYLMASKNYNIAQFADYIKRINPSEFEDNYKFKFIIILNRLKKENCDVDSQLVPLLDAFKAKFVSPKSFIEFYQGIKVDKSEINLYRLNQAFEGFMDNLPNPFETKSQNSQYRYYYLDYKANSLATFEFNNFLQSINNDINTEQILKLTTQHTNQLDKDFQASWSIINLLNRKINMLLDSKDKKCIEVIVQFLLKYNRLVVYHQLEDHVQNQIFNIIRKCIIKISIVIENDQTIIFANAVERYITRHSGNYHVEHNYRSLLYLLMKNIDIFVGKHSLAKAVIQQSLRLNILSAKVIQNIDLSKISLAYFDKLKIAFIKNPQLAQPIQNITYNSLKNLLHNPNYSQFVLKNQAKIIQLIGTYNPADVFTLAVYYNQNRNYASNKILKQILKVILQKINKYEGLDIVGFFSNSLNNNFFGFTLCKKITEIIVSDMSKKIYRYSIETHCEMIKFIVTQQGLSCNDYYKRLVEHFENASDYFTDKLFFRLAHTTYAFRDKDIKVVQNLIKKNLHQAVFFFLMVQKQMTPQYRQEIVIKIVSQFNKSIGQNGLTTSQDQKQLKFMNIHIQYLKLAYPEATKSLLISEKHVKIYSFSIRPKNTELYEQISRVTSNQLNTVSHFGKQNFLLKINRFVILFLNPRRIGAYYQHQFLKRAIPLLMNEQVQVICFNTDSYQQATLDYFHRQTKDFLSVEQISRLNHFAAQRQKKSKGNYKNITEVVDEE